MLTTETQTNNRKGLIMKRLWQKIMRMNIVKLYLLTLLFQFSWTFTVGIILYLSGAEFSQHVASDSDFTSSLFLIPMCAFFEELLFRWFPMIMFFTGLALLGKVCKFGKVEKMKIEKYGVAVVVIASSVVFGLIHGNAYNILLQGVSGVIFCMFYLRTLYRRRYAGKVDRLQKFPVLSSTIYHTLSNSILIIL